MSSSRSLLSCCSWARRRVYTTLFLVSPPLILFFPNPLIITTTTTTVAAAATAAANMKLPSLKKQYSPAASLVMVGNRVRQWRQYMHLAAFAVFLEDHSIACSIITIITICNQHLSIMRRISLTIENKHKKTYFWKYEATFAKTHSISTIINCVE